MPANVPELSVRHLLTGKISLSVSWMRTTSPICMFSSPASCAFNSLRSGALKADGIGKNSDDTSASSLSSRIQIDPMPGRAATNCLSRSLNSASLSFMVCAVRPRVICSTLSKVTLIDWNTRSACSAAMSPARSIRSSASSNAAW
jgi:hypothetical protein